MDPLIVVGIALSFFVVSVLLTAYFLKMSSKMEAIRSKNQIPVDHKNHEEPEDAEDELEND